MRKLKRFDIGGEARAGMGFAGTGSGLSDSRNFATWQDWAFAFNNALRR
jgi:hypothetical protein